MPIKYESNKDREPDTNYGSPLDEWMARNSVDIVMPRIERAELDYARAQSYRQEFGYSPYGWRQSGSSKLASKAIDGARIALGRDHVAEDEALNILKTKKTEETEWAQIFGASNLSPESTIKALQSFVPWVETIKPWYAGSDNSDYLISPQRMTPIMNAAIARAIKTIPALEEQVMKCYEDLYSGAKREADSRHSGPHTIILRRTDESLNILAKGGELSSFYYPDEEAILELMAKLTRRKIIDRDSWYMYGLGLSTALPNLKYMEKLTDIMAGYDKSSGPYGSRHERYYSDACSFSAKIIRSFTTDDRRNTNNANVIMEVLERTKSDERQPFSPGDFIRVANAISRHMNSHTGSNFEPLERTKPENLPLAVLRLSSITRPESGDGEVADQLEYEETVYLDVLTYMIGEAVRLHADWFLDKLIKSTKDYKTLLPRTYRGNGAAARRGHSIWRKWQPGYGKLS